MVEKYRTVGSFVLFKELAEDELGHIYRAGELGRDALLRTVWLRLFDAPGIPREELARAVATASEIGSVLAGTNIAANPVFFVEDGQTGMAWDYAPGQPLGRVFGKMRVEGFPVPVDNALLIVEKVALGLSSALAVDVGGVPLVHGFLTPGMITVTNDGEAVVAGFGLGDALLGCIDDEDASLAAVPYLAPEVLVSRVAGKRGDVYSLGAILFQLLAGQPLPALAEERAGALAAASLAFDEGPIPQDIMTLLTRSLADRPEDRFSSAADFKKELDKLLFGGAYSPTTFNLALFMDRLFRSEIETEDRERPAEQAIDVQAYLEPGPPAETPEAATETPAKGGGKGVLIGIAAAAVVVAGILGFVLVKRGPSPAVPAPTPTPTAEQIAAREAAQQKQVEALVEQQVAQMMAQREEQIRKELLARQAEIAKLQKKLQQVAKSSTSSAEARRKKRQIQARIEAEKKAAQERQAALEKERKKAREEAARKVEASLPPSPVPTKAGPPAGAAGVPKPTAAPPTPTPGIREGQFVDPTQVDTRPVLLKMEPVVWSPAALRSNRRGVVIMSATVNARGLVTKVDILRADDSGFGIPQAAVAAARKYIFKPATKDGVKVTSKATITIPYSFRNLMR